MDWDSAFEEQAKKTAEIGDAVPRAKPRLEYSDFEPEFCNECGGDGQCHICNGIGLIDGPNGTEVDCAECGGSGYCAACEGSGENA